MSDKLEKTADEFKTPAVKFIVHASIIIVLGLVAVIIKQSNQLDRGREKWDSERIALTFQRDSSINRCNEDKIKKQAEENKTLMENGRLYDSILRIINKATKNLKK